MSLSEQAETLTPLQAAAVSRKLVEAEIVSRAWSDPDFRAKLESDPKGTLAVAGLDVPDSLKVSVLCEPADVLQLVLPPRPKGTEELAESELSAVAGGSPGLIAGGNCRMADIAKKDFNKGGFDGISGGIVASFSLTFGSVVGLSWCWN
jgi:hypothetical protein